MANNELSTAKQDTATQESDPLVLAHILLPSSILLRLIDLSHITDRDKDFFVIESLKQTLDHLEDLYISIAFEDRPLASLPGDAV